MRFIGSLYTKLAAVFLLLIIVLGSSLLLLSRTMSEAYSQEIMQRLNQSVAMYITEQEPLIINGRVDESVVAELASKAMILNPSLEIYILDKQGEILSHRMPEGRLTLSKVDLEPVKAFLKADRRLPLLGQDPSQYNAENAISVSPIMYNGQLQGYVYAIIGGQMFRDLRETVTSSYVMRVGLLWMLLGIIAAGVIGCVAFFLITRRLSRLRSSVETYSASNKTSLSSELKQNYCVYPAVESSSHYNDEIDLLSATYENMQHYINQQFSSLEELDKTRRELIANVSHDLRTPLASIQGYIETLLLKNSELNEQQRYEYLNIAHKHGQRLAKLVSDLFELSKLESGNITPDIESFSLLELMHDCVQEFTYLANQRSVNLQIITDEADCFVKADIALIHRVLQNLVDNAIQHTPENGQINIKLRRTENHAEIEVSDTGKGIQTHEIPYIFDRFYQPLQQRDSKKIGAGLGLAIVKRILDLHQSPIAVSSQVGEGTSFVFELPHTQGILA